VLELVRCEAGTYYLTVDGNAEDMIFEEARKRVLAALLAYLDESSPENELALSEATHALEVAAARQLLRSTIRLSSSGNDWRSSYPRAFCLGPPHRSRWGRATARKSADYSEYMPGGATLGVTLARSFPGARGPLSVDDPASASPPRLGRPLQRAGGLWARVVPGDRSGRTRRLRDDVPIDLRFEGTSINAAVLRAPESPL
jgi:hypothetical protein